MKRALLLCFLIACATGAFASHSNKMFMKRPISTWSNYPADMKGVDIEVTPLGIYARIDLTFTVGPSTNPHPSDSQEAVLFFDLPQGSYVHDSWLWLNPTTIISAELMERRKASEVYAAIVHRRRDPSLLVNVLDQTYQLNIYPVSSGYWRQVKITYSTPVLWQGGRANVPLPLDLLAASQTPPSFSLKVNSNGMFYNPQFVERPFGSWVTAQGGSSYQLSVPATGYTSANDLTLSYEHYHLTDSRLSIYPTGTGAGIYELIVPPSAVSAAPRHINFVIDHQQSLNELYSLTELRRMMHQVLSTSLRPTDRFNIYYRNSAGTISSLFSSWQAADSAGIGSIAPAFTGVGNGGYQALADLLKPAMLFTGTGPTDAETIILNSNYFSANASVIQNLMTSLRTAPGIFSRRASVIHYHYTAAPGQLGFPATTSFYLDMLKAIADSTAGAFTAPSAFYYNAYTQRHFYDFNLRESLRQSVAAGLPHTAAYQVQLPLAGFTYNEHTTSTAGQYSPYATYTESGRYYGTFNAADSVRMHYASPGGMMTGKWWLGFVSAGDQSYRQTWNYFNNKTLAAFGSTYKQEIIDSSIANRVMSDFTAFLALETGDTIKASVGQNISVGFPMSVTSPIMKTGLTIYPNPFRNQLTIHSSDELEGVRVYNIAGVLLLSKVFVDKEREWVWDGKDRAGRMLPAGVYLIRVAYKDHSEVIKVTKLSD